MSTIGSFFSSPTSTTLGQDLTIYCMNFCNSLFAGLPDVIAEKTREGGRESLAYDMIQ